MSQPNVVFVFGDQWRYQALGFAGNDNLSTPNLDRLAKRSLNFKNAISGCPVCCPARASLLTGQYPDRHGVFVNDVHLSDDAQSLGKEFKSAGYHTAWIGKWHLDGRGRTSFTPPESRQGFDHWMALECTHDYNQSVFYAGNDPVQKQWDGYDAMAQTRAAQAFIQEQANRNPFLLVLSWGPPHNPYETAPDGYRTRIDPAQITLRRNVPPEKESLARTEIAGYYAHCIALDDLVGDLLRTLDETGIGDNTLFVFWSDHGDMLHFQGEVRKQRPWEESIHVPLLVCYPNQFGTTGRTVEVPINTPDLMPTLLGLCKLPIQPTVQGQNYAPHLLGEASAPTEAVLLACYHPFGEYERRKGGCEYRGVRTRTHTYARTLDGPWLLYDNVADPYQLQNLVNQPAVASLQAELDQELNDKLAEIGDEFLHGNEYLARWRYAVDEHGTVPY